MRRSFKYRVKMGKKAERALNQWLLLNQRLYNAGLEQRIAARNNRKSISCRNQLNQLVEMKKAVPEYKQVGSQCLQDVLERLDKAFKAFFRRIKTREKPGFPRFKSKNRYNSFTLKQSGWKLDGRKLYIKNVGRLHIFLSRPIEGKIKTVTVVRESTGKWFVTFSCDNVPERFFPKTEKEVGIDVGIKVFCTDSDGNSFPNQKNYEKLVKDLRRKQRALDRKKRGSKRRKKARVQVARIHEKIRNQRNDFLHKTANYYIKNYKRIFVEKLNIKGMVKNRRLSTSISDAGWGRFFEFLAYKAEEAGRQVKKVNPRNTSQKCSGCGEIVPKSLAVRVHKCPFCKLEIDRDLNASLNIKMVGQAVQALSTH